jgi:hypothetical protein
MFGLTTPLTGPVPDWKTDWKMALLLTSVAQLLQWLIRRDSTLQLCQPEAYMDGLTRGFICLCAVRMRLSWLPSVAGTT